MQDEAETPEEVKFRNTFYRKKSLAKNSGKAWVFDIEAIRPLLDIKMGSKDFYRMRPLRYNNKMVSDIWNDAAQGKPIKVIMNMGLALARLILLDLMSGCFLVQNDKQIKGKKNGRSFEIKGTRQVKVAGDIRLRYRLDDSGEVLTFVDFGSHNRLHTSEEDGAPSYESLLFYMRR